MFLKPTIRKRGQFGQWEEVFDIATAAYTPAVEEIALQLPSFDLSVAAYTPSETFDIATAAYTPAEPFAIETAAYTPGVTVPGIVAPTPSLIPFLISGVGGVLKSLFAPAAQVAQAAIVAEQARKAAEAAAAAQVQAAQVAAAAQAIRQPTEAGVFPSSIFGIPILYLAIGGGLLLLLSRKHEEA